MNFDFHVKHTGRPTNSSCKPDNDANPPRINGGRAYINECLPTANRTNNQRVAQVCTWVEPPYAFTELIDVGGTGKSTPSHITEGGMQFAQKPHSSHDISRFSALPISVDKDVNEPLRFDSFSGQSLPLQGNIEMKKSGHMLSPRIVLLNHVGRLAVPSKSDSLNWEPFAPADYTMWSKLDNTQLPRVMLPSPTDIATFSSKTEPSEWTSVQHNRITTKRSSTGILVPRNSFVNIPASGLYEKTALYQPSRYPGFPLDSRCSRRTSAQSNKQLISILKVVGNILCPGLGTMITLGQIALGQKSIFSLFGSMIGLELLEELLDTSDLLDFAEESMDFSDLFSAENNLDSHLLNIDTDRDIFTVGQMFEKFQPNTSDAYLTFTEKVVDTPILRPNLASIVLGRQPVDNPAVYFTDTAGHLSLNNSVWNTYNYTDTEKLSVLTSGKSGVEYLSPPQLLPMDMSLRILVDAGMPTSIDSHGTIVGFNGLPELDLNVTIPIKPIHIPPHRDLLGINESLASTIGRAEVTQRFTDEEFTRISGSGMKLKDGDISYDMPTDSRHAQFRSVIYQHPNLSLLGHIQSEDAQPVGMAGNRYYSNISYP